MTATVVWTLTISVCVTGLLSPEPLAAVEGNSGRSKQPGVQTVRVALIQFDAAAEKVDANLAHAEKPVRKAASQGAKWIMFHEGTLCDYTDRLAELAEQVPDGPSTQRLQKLSGETDTLISFGLSEWQRQSRWSRRNSHLFTRRSWFQTRIQPDATHSQP